MSGWCKWSLSVDPVDRVVKSYDVKLLKLPSFEIQELELKFSVSGGSKHQELMFNAVADPDSSDVQIGVQIPTLPDFNLLIMKNNNCNNSSFLCCKWISTLKFREDYQYQLIYKEEERYHENILKENNRSLKSKKTNEFIHERLFSLNTPFNTYRLSREDVNGEENSYTKILVLHENLSKDRNWLQDILPPPLWEDKSKAWLEINLNWNIASQGDDFVNRETVCHVKIPQSTVQIIANALEITGRKQVQINVTNTDLAARKMMAFANFSYDFWSSYKSNSKEKEIKVWNITIPRKSWSVRWKKIILDSKSQYEVELKSASMECIIPQKNDYVGWWSQDVAEEYRLEEHNVKTVLNVDSNYISSEELVKRYSNISLQEVAGLNHKHVKVDMALSYPFNTTQESLLLDGYIIFSRGPTTSRFQKYFNLVDSYNNFNFGSHLIYRADNDDTNLHHKLLISHTPSETKAFNSIDYKRIVTPEGCSEVFWEHDIHSHILDSTCRASYKCHPGTNDLHKLHLSWITNSSSWNMLEMKLNQVIDDINAEYSLESVNISHPLAVINVTADWVGKQKDHSKKVVFTCLAKNCHNAVIHIKSLHNGEAYLNLDILSDKREQISLKRFLSSDAKLYRLQMKYLDEQEKDLDDIDFSGEILREDLHVWKAKVSEKAKSKIESLITKVYNCIKHYFGTVAKDSNHPINKNLEPILKMTLFELYQDMEKQVWRIIALSWSSIQESLISLTPFFEVPIITFEKTLAAINEYYTKTYETLKQTSVIIWAVDYFNLPYYIYEGLTNINKGIEFLFQEMHSEEGNKRFEFTTGRILKLTSFKEWPSISLDIFKSLFSSEGNAKFPNHQAAFLNSKIAVIFRLDHIYTFDGHLFDSVEFSPDCLFLLAHDLRKSMFSVLSSGKAIHLLFPEMTLTINDENEVFVNGSTDGAQLPFQADNGKVFVRRGAGVEVWTPYLRLVCKNEDSLCVLELNSLHNGGTFGLLGNADGALDNEYMMPNGEISSDVLEFMKSYEISDRSECKIQQPSSSSLSNGEKSQLCLQRFEALHKLSLEIQDPLLRTCDSDLIRTQERCCSAAHSSDFCLNNNLQKTHECKAKREDVKRIEQHLKLILIVHEHVSLKEPESKRSPSKNFERLLTTIEEVFKSNGYSSIEFSLIGFGGKGMHFQPNIYTPEKNVWLPLQASLHNVFKNLKFEGESIGDYLGALKYSLDTLGYDTFDSKVIIMVNAQDKLSKTNGITSVIQNQLEKNSITLYTISNYPSIDRGKIVFGLRANGFILPSSNEDKSSYMEYPKGDLAKLTSVTGGSIFLSKFLIENDSASYYEEIAKELWAKVSQEINNCRDCRTVRSGYWFAVNECKRVECTNV